MGTLVGHRPEDHHGVLRLAQSRPRDGRGHAVPRPARYQRRRARHQDRQGGVEDADRGLAERLCRHQRAALLRRHRLQRHRRRRVRHARPTDRARCQDRQDPVALPTPCPAPGEVGSDTWPKGSDPGDARRRADLEHARARSRTRPDLFRHRQLRAGLRRFGARGRQSVLRLDHGDQGQDRRIRLALPGGAPRHLGL